jgi:hypothetical protein
MYAPFVGTRLVVPHFRRKLVQCLSQERRIVLIPLKQLESLALIHSFAPPTFRYGPDPVGWAKAGTEKHLGSRPVCLCTPPSAAPHDVSPPLSMYATGDAQEIDVRPGLLLAASPHAMATRTT